MKIFVFFFVFFFADRSYSQQKIFYINIPLSIKQGSIVYDLHSDPKDSSFIISFRELPGMDRDASFYFLCRREFTKCERSFFINKLVLTPEMVADSLIKRERRFFRENIFYALFIKGENYYIHRIERSEYLYKNYKDE
ncbi:MAG TPA: hypothetical protein VG676_14620 [Chitinophagaceae bacterium]|jgi:hypothetical protein|nr:hypothetical protein [Chitinophagaceae bacterium]